VVRGRHLDPGAEGGGWRVPVSAVFEALGRTPR
jgi:hypothetical protein